MAKSAAYELWQQLGSVMDDTQMVRALDILVKGGLQMAGDVEIEVTSGSVAMMRTPAGLIDLDIRLIKGVTFVDVESELQAARARIAVLEFRSFDSGFRA